MKRVFDIAFDSMRNRGWTKVYVLVDVHGVIMKPNYCGASDEIYSECLAPLKRLSDDPRFTLVMWTCSSQEHADRYRAAFREHGIEFDYYNENPEVTHSNGYGDYTKKLYANVICDDKAGFEPSRDWPLINEWLDENL